MNSHEVILHPVVTEKSLSAEEQNGQYVFKVAMRANRLQVRNAVEEIFDVNVEKVRVMRMPAKTRRRGNRVFIRRAAWKKAVVSVARGQSINLYDRD